MDIKNKKLTIITINLNNLQGLKRTIEGVFSQTWQEFEYIVIDGGSKDGSAEFLKNQSENIDYWISEPDKGVYNAMNKGIQKAKGEYLLFLNSGDHFYSSDVLKENYNYFKDYDLVSFDLEMVDDNGKRIMSSPYNLKFSDLYKGTLPHPATFIKKELFKKIGLYDEKLKIVSDWKFFIIALFKHNCSYLKIKKTLAVFYLDGISSTMDFTSEREQVLEEHFNGFILDYKELEENRLYRNNRFIMLKEIEKSWFGKKIVSLFFRLYIVLFSNRKLKDILK
ncbi:Glycosyltransferase, GT2 family [Flavobacterium glycines]|uniref:Glycosyl transferase n=1 Tax=Flavobacterium glycines TaxID=551990 RepID=A0A1B9DH80_9FLAO|nr:glycosyltransferase family 2 protein [Flavobacterium glycines]OCB69056.1 hypothetical protein FBGL_13550 [Flavobacterium glycines]GEL12394.1 glycosyl transferase [Flavobacterium glycines]SDJ52984.1 Glycosyltransferase, GT2 family [Flavobacterium glycines]